MVFRWLLEGIYYVFWGSEMIFGAESHLDLELEHRLFSDGRKPQKVTESLGMKLMTWMGEEISISPGRSPGCAAFIVTAGGCKKRRRQSAFNSENTNDTYKLTEVAKKK